MSESLHTAVIQLSAGPDKVKNVRRAQQLVRLAVNRGAKFILLPEVFNSRAPIGSLSELKKVFESIPGPSTEKFFELARHHKVFILAGSVLERTDRRKAYNTSVLISPQGMIAERYRKQNLFDARVSGKTLKESRFILNGKSDALADVFGFRVGLSICYDLRFTPLYERYRKQGVDIICAPSSFTARTGSAHWEVLLRARAIENQCYVLAPNQAGQDGKGVATYGHSMIVDPWGKIIKDAGREHEKILYAVLSRKSIINADKILPSIRY